MKKNLLITAALLVAITLFTNKAKAQGNTAKVTIHLANAASIIMGANKDITFNYTTAADYAAAKDSTLNAHFTVISNTPYTINATTSTAFIDGSNSIAASVVYHSSDNTELFLVANANSGGGSKEFERLISSVVLIGLRFYTF